MSIEKGTVVAMHYDLKDVNGKLIESTKNSMPLEFITGHNNILPKLDEKVMGSNIGDKFSLTLTAKDAYGEHNETNIKDIEKSGFPDGVELKIGMSFMADMGNGQMPFIIKEVNDDKVKIDFNHPMAGQELTFDVEVAGTREATEVELQHGHVHAGQSSCEPSSGGCSGCGGGC